MEDGIENYKSTLFERLNKECKSNGCENTILYLYIPENTTLFTNCIITDSKKKIMDLSENNKGQVICFVKDETTKLYKSIHIQ